MRNKTRVQSYVDVPDCERSRARERKTCGGDQYGVAGVSEIANHDMNAFDITCCSTSLSSGSFISIKGIKHVQTVLTP